MPVPEDLTGDGELFMLRVRGESMIDAGIYDGDFVVVRVQTDADNGDIVVAGIPGEEATVKTFLRKRNKIVLRPANESMEDLVRPERREDLRQGGGPLRRIEARDARYSRLGAHTVPTVECRCEQIESLHGDEALLRQRASARALARGRSRLGRSSRP
jgi:hypothetical protein